jgi:hypothetical protein
MGVRALLGAGSVRQLQSPNRMQRINQVLLRFPAT